MPRAATAKSYYAETLGLDPDQIDGDIFLAWAQRDDEELSKCSPSYA
jgi:hypothetical protein